MPLYKKDTSAEGFTFRVYVYPQENGEYKVPLIFSGSHNETWSIFGATKTVKKICSYCGRPWGKPTHSLPLPPETTDTEPPETINESDTEVCGVCGSHKSELSFPILDEILNILIYEGYSNIFGKMGSKQKFIELKVKDNFVKFVRIHIQKKTFGASSMLNGYGATGLSENGNGFSPTPLGQEPQVNYEDNTSTATMLPPPGREPPKKWTSKSRGVPVKVGLGAKEIRNLKDLFDNVMLELNIKVTPAMVIKVKNLIHYLEGAYKLVERGNAEALAINQFIMWIEKEIYFNKNVK